MLLSFAIILVSLCPSFSDEGNFSVREREKTMETVLIDVLENSGFNRQKKNFRGCALVVTALNLVNRPFLGVQDSLQFVLNMSYHQHYHSLLTLKVMVLLLTTKWLDYRQDAILWWLVEVISWIQWQTWLQHKTTNHNKYLKCKTSQWYLRKLKTKIQRCKHL